MVSNTFDLEQKILQCWGVVDDLRLLATQQAPAQEYEALATLYERKFNSTFAAFEQVCAEIRQYRNK